MQVRTGEPKQTKTIRLHSGKIKEIKRLAKKNKKTEQYFYENAINEYLQKIRNEAEKENAS